MKRIRSSLLVVAASVVVSFFISISPAQVDAAEIHVGSSPGEFATIQDAISSPTFSAGDTIVVDPGSYPGGITLPNNVTIKGTETARTFLVGNGSLPVVTVNGTSSTGLIITSGSVNINNFTFINAISGISLQNNTTNNINVSITNNVFQVGQGGTAITEQYSSSTTVANNTFYQNGTAIACDSDIDISNNIFSANGTAIVDTSPFITRIVNNAFSGNFVSGPTGTNPIAGDPCFADPANRDFHLKEGNSCIVTAENISTPPDVGAYSGSSADTIPFPVANLSITSSTTTSVELTWSPNNCYLMTNPVKPGIYSSKLSTTSGGPWSGLSTTVSAAGLSFPVSFALPESNAPTSLATPVLDPPSPRNEVLLLTWAAVDGANGYQVHYGTSSIGDNSPIDVGNTTSFKLSGLTNGQTYHVAVSSYYQLQYFFVVNAYYGTDTSLGQPSADSPEASVKIGQPLRSRISNVQADSPEASIAYPVLPDMGGRCFIATAAYGDSAAPEVQALRAFRDHFLLTSAPGRMFVQWYYQHGPAAAAFLNNHPGCKPVVRAALMPAVSAAIFMTGTSMSCKAIVFLVLGAAIAFGLFRKNLSRKEGLR